MTDDRAQSDARQQHAQCPVCERRLRYQQYHAGFSDEGYLYCDRDATVLTWSAYDPRYLALADRHPWMLDAQMQRRIEAALKPCPCGGQFTFRSPPLCPYCLADVSALVPDKIYFVVLDRHIRGEDAQIWKLDEQIEPPNYDGR